MFHSLYGQDYFANILPFLNISVRRRGLRQRERFADDRLDLARGVHAKNLVEFSAQQSAARLQMSQVHADHANIASHKFHGIKPGILSQRADSSGQTSLSVSPCRGGKTVHDQSAAGTQALITSRKD